MYYKNGDQEALKNYKNFLHIRRVQDQILSIFQTNVQLFLKTKEQNFSETFTGFQFIPYLNNKKY